MSHFDPPSVRAMQALKRLGAAPANQGVGTSGLRRVSSALRRLSDLVDVRVSTLADKDSLVFDASSGVWVPGSPRLRLGELQDVEVVAPDDGYPLMWSSTLGRWVPEPDEDYTVSSVVMSRVWDSDGHSGLFDALGTNDGTTPFSNPSPALVTVAQSSTHDGRGPERAIDQTGNEAHTASASNSWWAADFKGGTSVLLSRIGIRNRTGDGNYVPRNFKVQGSNNGTDWTDLLTVSGAGPSGAGNWWSSAVSTTTPYRHLRILQTGNNSSGTQHLVIGEVEFWGDLLGQAPIRSRRIGTLGDVDLTDLADGNVLAYDSEDSLWKPTDAPSGGGGGSLAAETFDSVLSALSGKVHRWKFDEVSGATVADSVGSLPLTLSGTYTRNSDTTPTGRPSTYFSGTASQAVSSGAGSLPLGNAARTLLFITKTTSLARGFVACYGAGATRQAFGVTKQDSTAIVANFWTWSDDIPWAQSRSFTDGTWTLTAITYDGNGTLAGYRDGDQISRVLTTAINTASSNFYVGASMTGTDRYIGNIADVVVFNRALSKAELDRLYQALNGTAFVSGAPTTIKDRRWAKATTDVSIDEFNGSSIDPVWTYAAHASIPALPSLARPRYVQDAGVLSVKYGSETGTGAGTADGGAGRHHAILRPLSGAGGSMAVGDAFYCAQTGFVRDTTNHRVAGLVLSTSADSGAGQQLCVRWVNVGVECRVGGRTLSSWNGDTFVGGSDIKVFQGLVYIRIVKMTSTTWRWDTSADGVSWMLGSSTFAWAHEPTHVGFIESNWNTNTQSVVSYEFLRRQSGVM